MTFILPRRALVAVLSVLAALLVGALAGGCIVAPESDSDDPGTRQSANHARDYDTSCSTYCEHADIAR